MTDYLERLLQAQERNEKAQVPDWFVLRAEPVLHPAAGSPDWTAPADGLAAGEHTGNHTAAQAGGAGTAKLPGQAPEADAWLEAAAPSREEHTGDEGRGEAEGVERPAGVSGRNGGAEWLYERLRRSETQAGYGRTGAAYLLTAPEPHTPAGRGLTPEGLDRLFQRDARRYDGGFTLY